MMETIKYLNKYFITKSELLELTKTTETELHAFQQQGMMPQCSYTLKLSLESESFFGLHCDASELEYYAKGYISWLTIVKSLENPHDAYSIFRHRYTSAVSTLKEFGHHPHSSENDDGIESDVKEAWLHFLDGTYGLCTQSGLPEDIAAKALSIREINQLTDLDNLGGSQLTQLENAVNLLDSASSLFAPHERLTSSRHRLVDETRRKYKLRR